MGAVVDLVEDVVGGVVDVVEDVVGVVGDAIDWVVDEIVDPVLSGVGDIIDAALDDPIATIAKVAAVATVCACMQSHIILCSWLQTHS